MEYEEQLCGRAYRLPDKRTAGLDRRCTDIFSHRVFPDEYGPIFQKMDAQLEEGITEEELHAFMHVIDKVYYNMEKMKGENS